MKPWWAAVGIGSLASRIRHHLLQQRCGDGFRHISGGGRRNPAGLAKSSPVTLAHRSMAKNAIETIIRPALPLVVNANVATPDFYEAHA